LMYVAVRVGGPRWDEGGDETEGPFDPEDRTTLDGAISELYKTLDAPEPSRPERLAAADSLYRSRLEARPDIDRAEIPNRVELRRMGVEARTDLRAFSRDLRGVDRINKTYAIARAIVEEGPMSAEKLEESLNALLGE
jgi:hypothetical protein